MSKRINLNYLKQRNFISQITNEKKLAIAISEQKAIYCGFDPTATSLHLGNYVQLIALRWFQKLGLEIIVVLGGATGMIGDPSGKKAERYLLDQKTITLNTNKIKQQIMAILGKNTKIINNLDFYQNDNHTISYIEFLRDVGKYANLNQMISREQVKTRLVAGISYTEFSYMLLQGWDFYNLQKDHNCYVQLGGNDQWGNITFGVELIRKMTNSKQDSLCGVTLNLLTKEDGTKFGKSEGGAIWLDKNQTHPYNTYQFLLNQPDSIIENLLYSLTMLNNEEIKKLMSEHNLSKHQKKAQKELAKAVVKDLYSPEVLEEILEINHVLFAKDEIKITKKMLEEIYCAIGTKEVKKSEANLFNLLTIDICQSNREVRELIKNKSISINGEVIQEINQELKLNDFCLIKKGKKIFRIYKLIEN